MLVCALLVIAGCNKSASSPNYLHPEDGGAEDISPSVSPDVDEELALEAGQKRIIYHIGPVDLPANTKPEEMLARPLTMRFQTDEALWVTGFTPRVVDANGAGLPPTLLHHAIMSNMHEANLLCSNASVGNPFFIATSMLTEINLPQGLGYPILPNDPLEARVVLANPTEVSYADVFFELTLVARPMNDFAKVADVKPMLLELAPCSHDPLEVEPGSLVERNATYEIPMSARLILAHGALQDYGSAISLTAGKEIMPFWRAEAELGENHHIIRLIDDPFEDPAGIDLKAGDRITLGVIYDNVSEEWLTSATAAAMVYMTPK